MVKPEVLAPAGELEQLYAAVRYGADAVYLAAKDFGMRSAPANFTFDELKVGVDFAHKNNVKVFQTVNTLPTNAQIANLEDFLIRSKEAGVDAFIVADIGVLMLAKRVCPDVDIHISVQIGVVNYLTALELYNLGAKRVVLARELTIEEISEIRDNTPDDLEIECFVHGAICMSFSGRCLISQYFVNRDANRGQCAQPCRWEYEIRDNRDPKRVLEVVENQEQLSDGSIVSKGSYILNSKDLCLIEHIDKLINAGITSFKIEGRAKSSFYVASVVNAYSEAVDSYLTAQKNGDANWKLDQNIYDEVQKISHREYTTGFYFSSAGDEGEKVGAYDSQKSPTSLLDQGYIQKYQPLAVLLDDGWHQRGKFFIDDEVELLIPYGYRDFKHLKTAKVSSIKDIDGILQKSTPHADQLLNIELLSADNKILNNLPIGTFLRGIK